MKCWIRSSKLERVNISMYIAIKRITPFRVGEWVHSGKGKPPTQVTLSVSAHRAGVLIAALGDFSFDLYGILHGSDIQSLSSRLCYFVEKFRSEDGSFLMDFDVLQQIYYHFHFCFFLIIAQGNSRILLQLLICMKGREFFIPAFCSRIVE
ncbi:hypothetical protein HU200_066563 [Digitaria exilis]|uniref:Uncharacterized protein n=1 Tax=Digitaria exilis TaxID=1010633 RepID=A0A835A034_9POAL|nr:hypothetical protein HU200_066563 [Digitaria exilis]